MLFGVLAALLLSGRFSPVLFGAPLSSPTSRIDRAEIAPALAPVAAHPQADGNGNPTSTPMPVHLIPLPKGWPIFAATTTPTRPVQPKSPPKAPPTAAFKVTIFPVCTEDYLQEPPSIGTLIALPTTVPPRVPGAFYSFNVVLVNKGSCTWDSGYVFKWNERGDSIGADAGQGIPVSGSVRENYWTSFVITGHAPAQAGTYTGEWQMRDPGGRYFGPVVHITVATH
jgi:hypothetical protein